MKNVNLSKLIILVILTNLLMPLNFAMASDCKWSTIEPVNNGFLYSDVCHHRVGILVENEKDFEIEVKELRKAIDLKTITIKDLQADSKMWENEADNQFKRFENYRKAEEKRKWLYIGGGVLGTVLVVFLAGQVSK